MLYNQQEQRGCLVEIGNNYMYIVFCVFLNIRTKKTFLRKANSRKWVSFARHSTLCVNDYTNVKQKL